ncbi:hypothetical protein DEIGR_101640 [Deinococcus grandis]|uniref:Uncharacterized protein n=1 Tax=Deinococcus grandis TaxID=57498 RepID=A0A100HIX4_9DEIO|nr:hypothetical protein [Deinococcus grandis]BBN94890.1 hypothetical protein DEGR_16230 [Deinococcus grandis]GAQ21613.1 hypothetical protein DEIGR_101640 [Deinococcus grandis]
MTFDTLDLRWESWEGEEDTVLVLVNGTPLVELVRRWEDDAAQATGERSLAGSYAGLPARFAAEIQTAWLGEPERGNLLSIFVGERVALLECGCGELLCWPLVARIEMGEREVRWLDFQQPHRAQKEADPLSLNRPPAPFWSYAGFGPFVFERAAYTRAVRSLGRASTDS